MFKKTFKRFQNFKEILTDKEKRRIFRLKTLNVENLLSSRMLYTIILSNMAFIGIYAYYYDENYGLRLSISRKISKITRFMTRLTIPESLRLPLYNYYCKTYNVKKEDIVEDLASFKTFNEFFTRKVKTRLINQDLNEIISPSDSKILSISEVKGDECLLIKNNTYKLGHLLSGFDQYQINQNLLDTMKLNDKNNKIYQMIFYLNPGDYHRFHSPTKFNVRKRNHIVGYLKPVKEKFIAKYKSVYETNERVSIFGKSIHGFISMVFVGALNVGTIDLTFDNELKTNTKLFSNFVKCHYKDYIFKISEDINNQKDLNEFDENELNNQIVNLRKSGNYIRNENGIEIQKGEEIGRFNLGSTIVLLFEANDKFEFFVKAGDFVRYGQPIGKHIL